MILNNEEKKCLVDNLSWMITDMKYKHDETHRNQEYDSQGGYSPQLTAAIDLLDTIKKTQTIETTGCHRKSVELNCREFECEMNRGGLCGLSRLTFESSGSFIIGHLKCVQAKAKEKKEKDNGTISKISS